MPIHWFSVDERPVREKKIFGLKNIRIHRLDVIILACVQTLPSPLRKNRLFLSGGGRGRGSVHRIDSLKASTRVSREADR